MISSELAAAQPAIDLAISSVPGSIACRQAHASTIAILFAEAVSHHQDGRRAEAIAAYEGIVALDPSLPEAHSNLGAVLASLGRPEAAEAPLRRAISLQPGYSEAHANLGLVLKDMGRLDEAEASLRRALALRPNWPEVLSKLGVVLYEIGRLGEAEEMLRRALEITADLGEAWAHLAVILQDQGRPDEAEVAFRQAVRLAPDAHELHFRLGTALLNLERPREAAAVFRQVIALKPNDPDAYNNLGLALRGLGAWDEAAAALREAIALGADPSQACNNLGSVLLDLDRLDEAIAAYREAIALNPHCPEAHNNLSMVLKERGRLAEACATAERAIQLSPGKPAYYLNLGDLRPFIAGEPHVVALEDLARDAGSLPVQDQIELHLALAKAYEDHGRYEECFRRLQMANALKRRQIVYHEATILDGLRQVERTFTPDLIRSRQNSGEPSPAPIFIVGMLRSGSTLVEQILASHPRVHAAGEIKNLGNAAAAIRSSEDPSAEFPAVVPMMSGEQLRAFGRRYVAEITRMAPSAARITNKMPSNYITARLIHLTLPNAVIIHIVRDPIDTCVSCFSKLFAEEQNHTYDLAELGRYYTGYRALMRHWQRVLPPGRMLEVRYEDIVEDLEGMARKIVAHCGLEWDPRCLDFHRTERLVRTASATQVRRPIYTSAIGRWRDYAAFLGPLLAELSSGG